MCYMSLMERNPATSILKVLKFLSAMQTNTHLGFSSGIVNVLCYDCPKVRKGKHILLKLSC